MVEDRDAVRGATRRAGLRPGADLSFQLSFLSLLFNICLVRKLSDRPLILSRPTYKQFAVEF